MGDNLVVEKYSKLGLFVWVAVMQPLVPVVVLCTRALWGSRRSDVVEVMP